MFVFVTKRLVYIIFNMLIVSGLIFIISRSINSDPIANLLDQQRHDITPEQYQAEYRQLSDQLGYNLPVFYIQMGRQSGCDTLYRLTECQRSWAELFIGHSGNWPATQSLMKQLNLDRHSEKGRDVVDQIFNAKSISTITDLITAHSDRLSSQSSVLFKELNQHKKRYLHFIPSFTWYGVDNQFHRWIRNLLMGDFGTSSIDGRSSKQKILEAMQWTVMLNFIALILIFGIGILSGIWSGYTTSVLARKIIRFITYMFYATPVFWLATILIVFFSTDDYGSWTNWFASVGLFTVCIDSSIIYCFISNFKFLILPIICITLPSLAYVSRHMESSITTERKKRYALFLKSQGFSRKSIYFKHLFKNASIPIITLLGQALPALLSGSLVIEIIFNIPGLGRLLYESINAQDWNVAFILIFLSALLLMIGYLVVDLLYKWAVPKISLKSI